MDTNKVIIDANATIGKSPMLIGVSEIYNYVDGKKIDTIIGYKYEVVLPDKMYDKLSVRILGDKKLDMPENETPTVIFEGLEMNLYWSPQGHKVSASAENIKFTNPPKKLG